MTESHGITDGGRDAIHTTKQIEFSGCRVVEGYVDRMGFAAMQSTCSRTISRRSSDRDYQCPLHRRRERREMRHKRVKINEHEIIRTTSVRASCEHYIV